MTLLGVAFGLVVLGSGARTRFVVGRASPSGIATNWLEGDAFTALEAVGVAALWVGLDTIIESCKGVSPFTDGLTGAVGASIAGVSAVRVA